SPAATPAHTTRRSRSPVLRTSTAAATPTPAGSCPTRSRRCWRGSGPGAPPTGPPGRDTPPRRGPRTPPPPGAERRRASARAAGVGGGGAGGAGWGGRVGGVEVVGGLIGVAGADVEPDVQGEGTPHGEIDRQFLDSTAIRTELGWAPRWSLDDGLAATWSWY